MARVVSSLVLLALLCPGAVASSSLGSPLLPLAQLRGRLPSNEATKINQLLGLKSDRLRGGCPEHPLGHKALKIALCSWESLHAIGVGGVAAHVTEIAAALQRRGHEVHVYTRATEHSQGHEIIDGVHIHKCPIELTSDLPAEMNNMCNAFMYFMRDTEAHMMYNFDIVHAHDWLAAKAIVQMKKQPGTRTCVFTMHSTEFGRNGNKHCDGISEAIRAFEREGCEFADKIIAVSGPLCDEVKEQYGYAEKVRKVYNGVQLSHFEGYIDAAAFKGKLGLAPLQPMILFVGRLTTQKGPDILLDAMPGILQHRGDCVAVFVGSGTMKDKLQKKANEMGIGHACRFPGGAKADELANYYKSADAVVCSSRNEPFGIIVLEAWAAGKCPVVTTSGGPREFVHHEDDGYHVYPTAESVKWGVEQVLNDFDKARWMAAKGRERCKYEFSWDHLAYQTECIYYEAMTPR